MYFYDATHGFSKTVQNTYNHKQLYNHILVIGFGYLLDIITPKTRYSKIKRDHTNTRLPIKVKLIPLVRKMWETISSLTKRL